MLHPASLLLIPSNGEYTRNEEGKLIYTWSTGGTASGSIDKGMTYSDVEFHSVLVDMITGFIGNSAGLRAMVINLTLESGKYKNAAGNIRSFKNLAKYKPGLTFSKQGNLSGAFSEYRSLGSKLTAVSRGLSAGLMVYDVTSGQPTYKTEQDGVYWGISEIPFVGPPMAAFLFINSFIPVQYNTPFTPGRTKENWNSWVK